MGFADILYTNADIYIIAREKSKYHSMQNPENPDTTNKKAIDLSAQSGPILITIRTDNSQYGARIDYDPDTNARRISFLDGTGPLVGEVGVLHSTELMPGERLFFGENGHTSPIREISLIEPPEAKRDSLDFTNISLNDRIIVRTLNSEYEFKVVEIIDPKTKVVMVVSGTGNLVGRQGTVNGDMKVGARFNFGQSSTSNVESIEYRPADDSKINEQQEQRAYDEVIRMAGSYAEKLDHMAEDVEVDPVSGKISSNSTNSFKEPTDYFGARLHKATESILNKFANPTELYAEQLRNVPGVLDAQIVFGAIVMTYNSALSTAPITLPSGKIIRPNSDPKSDRGNHERASSSYTDLVSIDINPAKRENDGVTPTTSAVHELHHFTRTLSDAAMHKTEVLGMKSHLNGSNERMVLIGPEAVRLPTDFLYEQDAEAYGILLNRIFEPKVDTVRIQDQRAYLNELHSSFLQKKENWFVAPNTVYSTRKKGKHWEIVGDHPDDIESTKRLLGFLQGLYSLDYIYQQANDRKIAGDHIGPIQEILLKEFPGIYSRCGSLIGVARVVQQAERLVSAEWNEIRIKFADLLGHEKFKVWLDNWEKGQGVDGIRQILGC